MPRGTRRGVVEDRAVASPVSALRDQEAGGGKIVLKLCSGRASESVRFLVCSGERRGELSAVRRGGLDV